MSKSGLEDLFALQATALGLADGMVREYRFHPSRRWRFDFAWPDHMLAVEVEGGVWVQGRHNRGAGFLADMEKYNEAAIRGWRVLRVAGKHIRGGEAMAWLERALKARGTM